jgi:hypothetical protein
MVQNRTVDGMVDDAWAQETLEALLEDEGFTSHPDEGAYTGSGYGVATYPERSLSVDIRRTSGNQLTTILQHFARANADLLARPGHYVGGWVSPRRELVLDISIITSSRRRATELRDRYHQSCFYQFKETAA